MSKDYTIEFFSSRPRNSLIYLILLLFSVGISAGIYAFGFNFGIFTVMAVIGIPVLLYSVSNLKFGIVALLIFSFSLGFSKFIGKDFPLGVVLDAFLVSMLLGLLFRKWKKHDYALAKSPISVVVWVWIIYNCLEFFNPMGSREAWIYVIRGIAILMTYYFIVVEAVDGIDFVKILVNVWIALALVGAVYGLFQEFHGLTQAEKDWVARDEFRFNLIHNWGRYRIFSFFIDPTLFGILMSYTGLFCLALIPGPFKMWYKVFLGLSALIMFLAMVYAGTRTAYAMIPAGVFFFALLTFQKETLMIGTAVAIFGGIIIFSDIRSLGPFLTTNSLERIRSAFKPSEDPSFKVREKSQAFIKPFIQSHPFGSGLGSIGIWGSRFTPNSPLAKFAPDSGYVRVAVELGWVGLIVYCSFFATILIVGIRNYYRMRNHLLKSYLAALVAVVFSLVIANYPQEALIQAPTILIFYIVMALIVKLKILDEKITTK